MSLQAEQNPLDTPPPPRGPASLTPLVARPARDARYDWAAERTLLAWVRTGLAMMGFGFVVARFGVFLRVLGISAPGALPESGQASGSMLAGILMVGFGMAANVVAVQRFLRNHRALSRGEPVDPSPGGPAALAIFAALLGAALVLLLGSALIP